MADQLKKCQCCNGRGYHRCDCWPGDCICGWDDEPCEECGGDGVIYPTYDDWDDYHEPEGLPTAPPEATP